MSSKTRHFSKHSFSSKTQIAGFRFLYFLHLIDFLYFAYLTTDIPHQFVLSRQLHQKSHQTPSPSSPQSPQTASPAPNPPPAISPSPRPPETPQSSRAAKGKPQK